MKTNVILAGTLLVFGVAASAQETAPTPKAEVGFSYSYTRVNPGGTLSSGNANGGYGFVEYNFNKVVGLVAELGANYTGNAGRVQLGNTTFQYLFGPRFNWRKSRFTPYVQTRLPIRHRLVGTCVPTSGSIFMWPEPTCHDRRS